jgi:O-antigen ligase
VPLPEFSFFDRGASRGSGYPGRSGESGKGERARTLRWSIGSSKENFAINRELVDVGMRARVVTYKRAALMWWERPLFGAGLGAFWRDSLTRSGYPYVNHNTTLWFASEFGLFGVLLFMGGVLAATVAFIKHAADVPLARGAAGMMFAMLGASVGTEVMYQRYPWCIGGLALGLIARSRLRSTR